MSSLRRMTFPSIVLAIIFLACQPLRSQTLIDTVLVGYEPAAVAVNPATNMVYVINYYDETVSVLNAANDEVVATVTVGGDPEGLVVNPLTNRIYVVNDDGTVTYINGATNKPQSIQVGNYPWDIAINTQTNTIYVTNYGDDTVSMIDGATNLVTTIPVREGPGALAINTATNKIYVCNWSENTISVIDGAKKSDTGPVLVGESPSYIAVNTVTNKIYVANYSDNSTLSVINGATNKVTATLPLTDRPEDIAINPVTGLVYVPTADGNVTIVNGSDKVEGVLPLPYSMSACSNYPGQRCTVVDPVTNKIYIPADGDQLVTIDGNTNNVDSLQVGQSPTASDINLGTNRLYVANYDDNTISVVAGVKASPMQWYSMTPCRVFDSRPPTGKGPITGGSTQHIFLPQQPCGTPATAAAYSLNVTVAPRGSLGYLTIWPTGEPQPLVSTMNSSDARVKANAAIVPSGASGGVDVFVTDTTDVILDIDGYFAPVSSSSYEFFPLTPCRVLDTRKTPNGPLAGPRMEKGQIRDFPILSSPCLEGINNPQAYSFNVTASPNPSRHPLAYLSIWPANQTQQPVVSTLNNPTGTAVANAAIVPASPVNGDIKIYTYDSTDVIVDINGYFGQAGSGGLSMYPLEPCRALDTRANGGLPFQGTLSPPINVAGSVCAPDASAQAYIFNATVVPYGVMGYLTLWAAGAPQMPVVSTLNAYDGRVTSNMAIVPNKNGSIEAYADGLTHLIMDISGYFAPQSVDDGRFHAPAKSAKPSVHPRGQKRPAAPKEGWPER